MARRRIVGLICVLSVLAAVNPAPSITNAAATPTPQPQLVKDINTAPDYGIRGYFDEYEDVAPDFAVFGSLILYSHSTKTGLDSLYKASNVPATSPTAPLLARDAAGDRIRSPQRFLQVGSTLYFATYSAVHGSELWKSDGTESGTVLVKDVHPGYESSNPHKLTAVGSTLYFVASDGVHGWELWKTDGTEAGTVMVKDIRLDGNSYADQLTVIGSTLYFTADDGVNGWELWKSDGTEAGTVIVKDIFPGNDNYGEPNTSYPYDLAVAGTTLYFTASDGTNGRELWKSDGSNENTALVKDIIPGSGSSFPSHLTGVESTLYFTATNGTDGYELWKSDGDSPSTVMVKDIESGSNSSNPDLLTAVGSTLYFSANDSKVGDGLWLSDGTTDGTVLVKAIFPERLTAVGSTLYFTAEDATFGREVWISDGTTEGTNVIKDIRPGPDSSTPLQLTAIGSSLYFVAEDGVHGWQVWRSDGTATGTVLMTRVLDGNKNSYPAYFRASIGSTLYFTANDGVNGEELWRSDGTAAGTIMVKDIRPGADENGMPYSSDISQLTVVGSVLYFSADDGSSGRELWKSDGTAAGTVMVKDIRPENISTSPENLTAVGSTLFFSADDGTHGFELWESDGTAAGTVMVKDIFPGLNKYEWPNSSYPYELTAVGSTLFFVARDSETNYELWKSDGSTSGTIRVKDINPGVDNNGDDRYSNPYDLTTIGSTLFFSAQNSASGYELWRSDGTADGTIMVKDINTGTYAGFPYSSYPYELTAVGSTLYFGANDGTHGFELWKSDGTEFGTTQVKDIFPGGPEWGPNSSGLYGLTAVGSSLFFGANDGEHGYELWASDGTESGTSLTRDINPDSVYGSTASSYPSELTAVGTTLYFGANDENHGDELWTSNGTEAGTTLVRDIAPGPGSSSPWRMTNTSYFLFFSATTDAYGTELWAVDFRSDDTITWNPALSASTGATSHNLGEATAASGRQISYTVLTTGSASCVIPNPASPVVTYSSAGSCTVTAATADSPGYRGVSMNATLVISATTPPTTTTVKKIPPSLTPKKQVSSKSLLSYLGVKPIAKSKIRLAVAVSSKKHCKVSGTYIKYVKAGSCTVSMTVTPPKGKGKAKTYKVKLVGKTK